MASTQPTKAHLLGSPTLEPFTVAIIEDALLAIVDEMLITTQRASHSLSMSEVLDFAVGLTDAAGNLITQGNGITFFLGTLDEAVRTLLRKFQPADLAEGDVIIANEPYIGTHLSDVSILMPIFYGDELIAFACNKGHWTDVGGAFPGSVSTETTEIYQEGIQFPCIKIFERGEARQDLLDLIAVNVRLPSMMIGDLHAQVASVRLAARRLQELCAKYGAALVMASIQRIMDSSAELTRRELEKLPAGTYEAIDWIDGYDEPDNGYKVCVKVTLGGERVRCDFTGTTSQILRSINSSRAGLVSAARAVFKAITGVKTGVNQGSFQFLDVVCPSGTVFTCERPAASSTYWESLLYAADLIWRALAEAMPDRMPAGHFLSACGDLIAGSDPDSDELFILIETNPGGWGGALGKDGERALVCLGDGETYMMPVEVAEQKYGVQVEQYAFQCTGAGAGKWRGGEGIVKDYRITVDDATVTGIVNRHRLPPWGLSGGQTGSVNEIQFLLTDGTIKHRAGMIAAYPMKRGEIVRILTGTGGGWGDPLERDPSLVAADVRNDFISTRQAEETYGVLVDPGTFRVLGLSAERLKA